MLNIPTLKYVPGLDDRLGHSSPLKISNYIRRRVGLFLQKMEKPTVRLSNPKKLHGFKKSPWLTGPFKPLKSANSTLQWKCLAHTPYPCNTWVLPRNVHAQTTVSEQEIKQGTPPTDLIQRRRPRLRGRNSWYTKCRSTHLHMITATHPTSKACGWKHFADFTSL